MILFPPDEHANTVDWANGLLSDLAGSHENSLELLEAVWDIQSGRLSEWSTTYNVYRVEIWRSCARITFLGDWCELPLHVLESAVGKRLDL